VSTAFEGALRRCKAGVIVIGRHWLAPEPGAGTPRLLREHDVVRDEIAKLIEYKKAVFPVLVEGASLPEASDLPDSLRSLLRFQATAIDNAGWEVTMHALIREIEAVTQSVDQRPPRGREIARLRPACARHAPGSGALGQR